MTAREVTETCARIMKRKNDEARFEAQIHGARLKEEYKAVEMKISPEQKEMAKKSMDRMVREKQEQLAKKKQGIK